MALLAAAGDPGGLRALLPALKSYLAAGGRVLAWKHRDLPAALPGVPVWEGGALPAVDRLVFSTSVADAEPLRLARRCRAAGIRVECVLDNWMNYRRRLELDGEGLFVPEAYYLMDDLARVQALQDGLPAASLVVSGHPGLSGLALPDAGARNRAQAAIRQALDIPVGARLVVFVSEPVEQDQGATAATPGYRGYTEKQVLAFLCAQLGAAPGEWALCILPHPRESRAGLQAAWQAASQGHAGRLRGGVLPAGTVGSNEAVAAADGVAGMASILIYEAWLMGRPALSLQPGLARADLRIFGLRPGVHCVESTADTAVIGRWIADIGAGGAAPRPELATHAGAAAFLARRWLA